MDIIITGGLAVTALTYAWFHTMLPTRVIRRIPVRIQGDWLDNWLILKDCDIKHVTRREYMDGLSGYSKLPPLFLELINCPYCLSFYFSAFVTLLSTLNGSYDHVGIVGLIGCLVLHIPAQAGLGIAVYKLTQK